VKNNGDGKASLPIRPHDVWIKSVRRPPARSC
jgi:hypothetical protein